MTNIYAEPGERGAANLSENRTVHEPIASDALGVPYFYAVIEKGHEYGICPRCGEKVLRTKGAFGRHWEAAVKYETQTR